MFVIFKIFVGGRNYRTQLEGFLEVIETGKFERKQEEEAPQLEKNEKRQPQMPSFNPT
jgi:hypothetical protein